MQKAYLGVLPGKRGSIRQREKLDCAAVLTGPQPGKLDQEGPFRCPKSRQGAPAVGKGMGG